MSTKKKDLLSLSVITIKRQHP